MDILIVSPAFAPYSGVGANRMGSLVNYLIAHRVNVTVIRNIASDDMNMNTAKVPKEVNYIDINIKNDSDFNEMQSININKMVSVLSYKTFDCIIVSVGPYYTYKCILEVKRISKTPVILDFRDLFVYECRRHDGLGKEIRRYIYHKRYKTLEMNAIAASSAIVTVTPSDLKVMQKKYWLVASNSCLIRNGYDEVKNNKYVQDEEVQLKLEHNVFYLGVFGKLTTYNKKLTSYILMAINKLNEHGYKVKIIQIGAEEKDIYKLLKSKGLDPNYYNYLGNYEYSKGMNILRKVDALTFVYSSKTGFGTKLFDYIYLNKPIILMTIKNTEIANIVNSFENGYVCLSDKQYESAISKIIDNKEIYLTNKNITTDFSREKQNAIFFDLIKRLVSVG